MGKKEREISEFEMDLIVCFGLVWKRVRKITFFGLKSGQDLESWAAHPQEEFPAVPPPPPPGIHSQLYLSRYLPKMDT